MILADKKLFTRDHYEAHKGFAPAHLCELVVYCLELVSQLSHRELGYRFKGGNSQLILLDDPQRFSIDVDIVSTVSKEEMIQVVEDVAVECELFSRCEVRQHKTKPWLPMISFKLYFDSQYQEPDDAFVMLDAVLEPAPYGSVTKTVACGDLYRSNETVELPSIPGLLGDKMLCLGPATLGIPLGKGKEAHRLKHVFDVATLSRYDYDQAEFEAAVGACMKQENQLQRSQWSMAEVKADTIKFCSEPLEHEQKPPESELEAGTYLDEIARGFDDFCKVLFRVDYTWERFRDDCRQIISVVDTLK